MPELTNRTSHRFFGSLQEAYDRLDAIIENSYDGIYITDGQAITLRINRAYETITGMKAEEVLGRSMWELEKAGTIDRSGTDHSMDLIQIDDRMRFFFQRIEHHLKTFFKITTILRACHHACHVDRIHFGIF